MELILKANGLLVDEGHTAEDYQKRPTFDPNMHQIVDTGQVFNTGNACHEMRSPRREVWFYFPTLNKFFLNEIREHAIVKAAREIFGEERWEAIEDELEETGAFEELLNRLDMPKLKRKIARARFKGFVTDDEVTQLRALVAHIGDIGI